MKVVENLLSKITRQQFIRKKYTNQDHSKFCIDKSGKDSGPEDDEEGNINSSDNENVEITYGAEYDPKNNILDYKEKLKELDQIM